MWLFLVTVSEEIALDNFNYLCEDVHPRGSLEKSSRCWLQTRWHADYSIPTFYNMSVLVNYTFSLQTNYWEFVTSLHEWITCLHVFVFYALPLERMTTGSLMEMRGSSGFLYLFKFPSGSIRVFLSCHTIIMNRVWLLKTINRLYCVLVVGQSRCE